VQSNLYDIYFIAIGGTGMAPLACLLKEQGHQVRGVDGPLYPPMSTLLAEAGIKPLEGYGPGHLLAGENGRPDLVIVGNAVPRHNPEVLAAEQLGLPRLSMPQALSRFFLADRQTIVMAGTHGKTTTTAMAAWVWTACGKDPGYLIGGAPKNLPRSFHVGSGKTFVIEGDEYNASYFDRGPKFLHYKPHTLILTSADYDHADLYPEKDDLLAAYRQVVSIVPKDGLIVACGDSPEVCEVVENAACKVTTYGLGEENDVFPLGLEATADGSRFRLAEKEGEVEIRLGEPGEHNVLNAMAVWIAARHEGLPASEVAEALGKYAGVQRRLEEIGTAGGVAVVDDFAHHPTAVAKSLGGLRQRYPDRRILLLYEPRSLTAGRAFLHDAYREVFAKADAVRFAPIFHQDRLAEDERVDLPRLSSELKEAGVDAEACASVEDVLEKALAWAKPDDVVATMSSGAFQGMPRRLLERLQERV